MSQTTEAVLVYIFFISFVSTAAYFSWRGFLKDDVDRERKWEKYEHRDRKDKQ